MEVGGRGKGVMIMSKRDEKNAQGKGGEKLARSLFDVIFRTFLCIETFLSSLLGQLSILYYNGIS